MKAGLLANIRVDPHTKISVTAAALKISLWTQLPRFLRSPTQEKLVILQLPYVRLLVETTDAAPTKTSPPPQSCQSPSFLKTLDTSTALKDIRHPICCHTGAEYPAW
ncbi:FMP27, C-terminal [Phytophthora cinnamomi]|uniref:FMP27, C-terminal n=1 Tax=Phytophthora cinnamomi TaxID=4785 RepID=UPI0035598B72|nr:FMP27, C-terminal [Phytophthora cinnamomi]